jgi:hypothetical protein
MIFNLLAPKIKNANMGAKVHHDDVFFALKLKEDRRIKIERSKRKESFFINSLQVASPAPFLLKLI